MPRAGEHAAQAPSLAGPGDRLVVTPNADTLYSNAWLDLRRRGPIVLSVPASDRYYVFQFLDMYTNTIANIGTRTNGNAAGRIRDHRTRLARPAPRRDPPHQLADPATCGSSAVPSSTSSTDLAAAVAQQQRDTLPPFGRPASTTDPAARRLFARDTAERHVRHGPRAAMAPTRHHPRDHRSSATSPPWGSVLGSPPPRRSTPRSWPGPSTPASRSSPGTPPPSVVTRDGWSAPPSLGTYGTDYVARAATAADRSRRRRARRGRLLPGGARQRWHRPVGLHRVPHPLRGSGPPADRPARAFWSVTAYGPDHFLVANAIGRYSLGDRTPGLQYGPDGSLDLYLAAQPPAGHETNSLPPPPGRSASCCAPTSPRPESGEGGWVPPVVQPG